METKDLLFEIGVEDLPPKNLNSFLEKIKKNTNCILSPHVAGVTDEANKRVSEFIANTVKEFFNL